MSDVEEIKKGIKFDATVNLGHILTFFGFIAMGFAAWSTLDNRLVNLESNQRTQELRDRSQDSQTLSQNSHISEALTDIKRSVEKLNDKVDQFNK